MADVISVRGVVARGERTAVPPAGSLRHRLGSLTTSLIIPARNEAVSLQQVLAEPVPDFIDEIIVVDGDSTDATVDVVARVCPRARIVWQTGRGKGDVVVRRRQSVGDGTREYLEVLSSLTANQEPRLTFAHEIGVRQSDRHIDNAVHLSHGQIEVSTEASTTWDAAAYREPIATDVDYLAFGVSVAPVQRPATSAGNGA